MPIFEEIKCKTAINQVKSSFLPYSFDLNPYRGCQHGCKYCFALYSHTFMEKGDFFGDILVKTNIAEKLDYELSRGRTKGRVINISGVTDCYQPCEEKYGLMRQILNVLIKHKNPAIISTKSALVRRDFDLIEQLVAKTDVTLAMTITTADEALRAKLEPLAAPTQDRFDILRDAKKLNVTTGVHLMPIIPFLTDSRDNLEAIFDPAKAIDIDYITCDPLNLSGKTKVTFTEFIKSDFPQYYTPILKLYREKHLSPESLAPLKATLSALYKKYDISSSSPKGQKINKEYEQLSLFKI